MPKRLVLVITVKTTDGCCTEHKTYLDSSHTENLKQANEIMSTVGEALSLQYATLTMQNPSAFYRVEHVMSVIIEAKVLNDEKQFEPDSVLQKATQPPRVIGFVKDRSA